MSKAKFNVQINYDNCYWEDCKNEVITVDESQDVWPIFQAIADATRKEVRVTRVATNSSQQGANPSRLSDLYYSPQ